MNTTRQIKTAHIRIMVILLIASYILCCFSLALMRQSTGIAKDAVELAGEATQTAAYYKELNKRLVEENEMLRDTILSYNPEEFVAADPAPPRYFDVALSEDLQDFIWTLCNFYEIEEHYELIYAMIKQESNFDPSAISKSNDYGLMQINVCNHESLRKEFGSVDFLDPYDNVLCGIYMISSLLHEYDVPDALMAYNLGERGASKLWRRGIHTSDYTEYVLGYYTQFTGDI